MAISLSCKKDGYVECRLCPNRCQLKEDEIGKCSVRVCDGDTIFLSNWGELASIAVNPIVKKPFQNYLTGTKTLSIGGVGCSLSCQFCENHTISQCEKNISYKKFSVHQLVDIAKEKHCKSVCMTFNEPTISFEYLMDLAEACHENDLKFILKTNAYVNKEPWAEICRVTDAMNIDWKGGRDKYHSIMGSKEFVITDRIEEAYKSNVHLEISIPLYNSLLEDLREFSQFLGGLDKNIPCHLLKVNPAYNFSNHQPTTDEVVAAAKEVMSSCISNIFMS